MPEIVITIDKDGTISIDAVNYHGQSCHKDTEAFARALGKTVKHDRKSEYWEQEQTQQQRLRHGM